MLYLSRMHRTGGIYAQERDVAILRGLYESRVMTTVHAAGLYFDERLEAARKHLQKLIRYRLATH